MCVNNFNFHNHKNFLNRFIFPLIKIFILFANDENDKFSYDCDDCCQTTCMKNCRKEKVELYIEIILL